MSNTSMQGDVRGTFSTNIFRDYQSAFETKALEQLFTTRKFVDVCTYFMTLDPLSAQVRKLAKLAITEFTFEGGTEVSDLYTEIFERIGLTAGGHTLDEVGMELLGYGNSMVSVYLPFRRIFLCKSCGKATSGPDLYKDKRFKEYRVHQWGLMGPCPHCKKSEGLKVKDMTTKTNDRARLTRWAIRDVDIKYIKSANERIYIYRPGPGEKRMLKEDKDIDHWQFTPWDIISAAHDDKEVRFYDDMIYHLRGPSINGLDSPWGLPLILPAMLLAMNMQQLRKANDVAAQDRSMAHTFIFPQPVPGMENPAYKINLEKWSSYVANEISIQRMDPARKSYVPFPLGQLGVGGDAKTLMMYPEISQLQQDISVALGLPAEFVFGGGNYASGVVSHRFVSMFLQTLQLEYVGLATWVIERLRRVYSLPKTKVIMRPPKMADDVQLYQLFLTLMQSGYMGPETFYDKTGIADWKEVKEDLERNSTFLAGQMKKQMLAQLDGTVAQTILQNRMMPQQPAAPPQGAPPPQGPPPDQGGGAPPPQGGGQPMQYPPEVVQQLQQMGVPDDIIQQAQQQGMTPDQLVQELQAQQGGGAPPAQAGPPPEQPSPYQGADGGVHPFKYPIETIFQLAEMGIPPDMIDKAEQQGMQPDQLVQEFQAQQPPQQPQQGGGYPPEVIQQLQQMGIPDDVIQQAMSQGVPPEQLVQMAQQSQGGVQPTQQRPPQAQQAQPQQQQGQAPPQATYNGQPIRKPGSNAPGSQMTQMANNPQGMSQIVQRLMAMPGEQVQQTMDAMLNENPTMYAQVTQYLQQAPAASNVPQGAAGAGAVDMRPMPQQLPPRRKGGV